MSLSLLSRIFLSALGRSGVSAAGCWRGGPFCEGGLITGLCALVLPTRVAEETPVNSRPARKVRRVSMSLSPLPSFPQTLPHCRVSPPMLYSPLDKTMSSLLSEIPAPSVSNLFHLIGIFIAVLLINRLLRLLTELIVKPAAAQTRAAQAREQQTRTLAGVLYSGGSKVVWGLALLVAAQE